MSAKKIKPIVSLFIVMLAISCKQAKVANGKPAGETARRYEIAVKTGAVLRSQPSTSAKMLASVPFGQSVEILSKSGEAETILGLTGVWYQVRFNNVQGWIFGPLLRGQGEKLVLVLENGKFIVAPESDKKAPEKGAVEIDCNLPFNCIIFSECLLDRNPESCATVKAYRAQCGKEPKCSLNAD